MKSLCDRLKASTSPLVWETRPLPAEIITAQAGQPVEFTLTDAGVQRFRKHIPDRAETREQVMATHRRMVVIGRQGGKKVTQMLQRYQQALQELT